MNDTDYFDELLRLSQQDLEQQRAKLDQTANLLEMCAQLMEQNKMLISQIETVTAERDAAVRKCAAVAKERDEARNESAQLKMEKQEFSKLSQKILQTTAKEAVLDTLRDYMNKSKSKSAKKRGYIKMSILEIAQIKRITLPEDMLQTLETFDDDNPVAPVAKEIVQTKIVQTEILTVEPGGTGVSNFIDKA